MKHAPADVIAINRRVLFVLWLLLQGLQLMTTVSQPVYDTKNDTVSQSSICLQKTVQFLDFCCCFFTLSHVVPIIPSHVFIVLIS